jgi:xanthine dehydrogenase accessory factor
MKSEVLDALVTARAALKPAVLLRTLDGGAQTLIVEGEVIDGAPLPADLDEKVRAAVRKDRSGTIETDAGPVFVQVFNPPLRVLIVGAVHIAQSLAPMAVLTGYAVTVVDPRGAFATEARFPGVQVNADWPDEALTALRPDHRTAVVTLTHDPKLDDTALDVALRSEAFYIGALGSRRTHAARLERLAKLGHDRAALARIHGPAGLDLGAVSPAEIAVSVMAQMTAVLRGADA